jgi:hypothetical protein
MTPSTTSFSAPRGTQRSAAKAEKKQVALRDVLYVPAANSGAAYRTRKQYNRKGFGGL